jgi:hypothetical protein
LSDDVRNILEGGKEWGCPIPNITPLRFYTQQLDTIDAVEKL